MLDLQVHTDASPCSGMTPGEVVAAARRVGLDGIAITDHDTMANVEAVAERAGDALEVVPGVEVTTSQGHLLAYHVATPPPKGADPLDVVDDVHDQGGVAILSHPFDRLRQVYDAELDRLARRVDAVEIVNSRCVRPAFNRAAQRFAKRHDLPGSGGSDAHFPHEIGRARTLVDGDLRDAVARDGLRAVGRGGHLSGHVLTKIRKAVDAYRTIAEDWP